MRAGSPSTALTNRFVSVATPLMCCRKLIAVRSPFSIAAVSPTTSAIASPSRLDAGSYGRRVEPSGRIETTRRTGSSRFHTATATSPPARMPSPFATTTALQVRPGAISESVVGSPEPRSSARALSTASSISNGSRPGMCPTSLNPCYVGDCPRSCAFEDEPGARSTRP